MGSKMAARPKPEAARFIASPPSTRGLTVSGARAPLCFETTRRISFAYSYLLIFFLDARVALGGPVRRSRMAAGSSLGAGPSSGRLGAVVKGGGGIVWSQPLPRPSDWAERERLGPLLRPLPTPLGGAPRGILGIHLCTRVSG